MCNEELIQSVKNKVKPNAMPMIGFDQESKVKAVSIKTGCQSMMPLKKRNGRYFLRSVRVPELQRILCVDEALMFSGYTVST
jgi:hypothetical protein